MTWRSLRRWQGLAKRIDQLGGRGKKREMSFIWKFDVWQWFWKQYIHVITGLNTFVYWGCHGACMEVRELTTGVSSVFFHHVDHKDWTQISMTSIFFFLTDQTNWLALDLNFSSLFKFVFVDILLACLHYILPGDLRNPKRTSEPLEPGLQTVVNCCVGAGYWTRFFRKSSQGS